MGTLVFDDDLFPPRDDQIWTITVDGVPQVYVEINGELYPCLMMRKIKETNARLDAIVHDH